MTMPSPLQAATAFLEAFDNLDWEPFSRAIAPDATVFMPFANVIRRLDGYDQIAAVFQPFFAQVRQQRLGPPYLNLHPLDLTCRQLGHVAIITFHLDDGPIWCRRTLILEQRQGQWLLIHLHASNMPIALASS